MADEDKEILETVKGLLNPDYSFKRFILDAITNKKLRYHQREKKARRKIEKATEAENKPPEQPKEEPKEEPKPETKEEPQEKERRPSLLNLAEIQAKFQQGLKEEPKIVIPPLIRSTKREDKHK